MKKKVKSKLILLFAGISSLFLLGGCALGESFEEVIENRDLTAQVTYYSNGGMFEETASKTEKKMYYQTGAQALNIGKNNPTDGTVSISRNNYIFTGWYHAVLDEEGNPVFEDEENGIYKLGEPADFSVSLQEGAHWMLIACWEAKVKLHVQLVCEEGKEISVEVGEGEEALSYKNGDIITSYSYGTWGEVDLDSVEPFAAKDGAFTFIEYYHDEACTQLVEDSLLQQDTDVTVYAKYVEGEWTVVKTVADILGIFNNLGEGNRYWLIKDVDLKGKKITPMASIGCEIQGNGYKIKNLSVADDQIKGNPTLGLFGNIEKSAILENILFEGLTIEYAIQSGLPKIYFACASIEEGAKIENVVLNGTMTITNYTSTLPGNLVDGFASCLFGGYDTDAAYLAASEGKGFKVNDGAEATTFVTIINK